MENRRAPVFFERAVFVPAAVTAIALAVLWGWGRWWYLEPEKRAEVVPAITAGWLFAMWVIASYATIGAVASIHGMNGGAKLRRSMIATAAIAASCALLLILVVINARTVSMMGAMQVYVLLLSWLMFLAAVTRAARVMSRALMVMGPSVLAALLMGLSVFAVPAVRMVGSKWASMMTTGIAYVSPTQALLSAIQPSLKIPLAQMPVMYQMSPLGQDIPMATPVWWVSAIVFGVLAGGIGVVDWRWTNRSQAGRYWGEAMGK